MKDQLLFSTYPVEGTLRQDHAHAPSATGTIAAFEFKTLERKELITKVTSFRVSADRKTVHDTVNEVEGVQTSSEGEDPRRYVVIRPA